MRLEWTTTYRMVPIELLPLFKALVRSQGKQYRVRYRGPHGVMQDTLKRNARAFTMYLGD
jgi:hypothetical protein